MLDVVCDKLPSPSSLSGERIESLISSQRKFDSLPQETRALKEAFLKCSPDAAAPTIVFISKMFAVDATNISQSSASRAVCPIIFGIIFELLFLMFMVLKFDLKASSIVWVIG